VVLVELSIISWVRHKFMDTPLVSALLQVALGGALVFWPGILIGIRERSRVGGLRGIASETRILSARGSGRRLMRFSFWTPRSYPPCCK
jgi:hypothetical protein